MLYILYILDYTSCQLQDAQRVSYRRELEIVGKYDILATQIQNSIYTNHSQTQHETHHPDIYQVFHHAAHDPVARDVRYSKSNTSADTTMRYPCHKKTRHASPRHHVLATP